MRACYEDSRSHDSTLGPAPRPSASGAITRRVAENYVIPTAGPRASTAYGLSLPAASHRDERGAAWPENAEALLVSKGWVQAVVLVVLFGFFVLGLLAYRTYQAKPPIPERVVDPAGELLYTERDVERGQEVFLNNGLMEYGSVFGHGAYLGPDYTADYLRRAANQVTRSYGGGRSDSAARRTIEDFRTNRYDKRTGVLELTEPQAEAHRRLVGALLALLLRAHHQARPAPGRDHRPRRSRRPDGLLRLDGLGRRRRAAGAQLLATRTTGRPSRAWTTSRRPT